jgi:hypothetical protein
MSKTIVTRQYLTNKGFTEDVYGFHKDEFSLMKTLLDISYEVLYKREIIKRVSRTVEDIEEVYEKLTSNVL